MMLVFAGQLRLVCKRWRTAEAAVPFVLEHRSYEPAKPMAETNVSWTNTFRLSCRPVRGSVFLCLGE